MRSRESSNRIHRDAAERSTVGGDARDGAMDATADAIFLVDAHDMKMIDVSDGACRMLGFSRDALLRIDPGLLL